MRLQELDLIGDNAIFLLLALGFSDRLDELKELFCQTFPPRNQIKKPRHDARKCKSEYNFLIVFVFVGGNTVDKTETIIIP